MKDFARRDTAASRSAPERKRRAKGDSPAASGRRSRTAPERQGPAQPNTTRSTTPVWLAFVTGMACGLFIAFLAGIGLPLIDGQGRFSFPGGQSGSGGQTRDAAAAGGGTGSGTRTETRPPATHFEFYEMFSKREVLVPQVEDLLPDGSRTINSLNTPTEVFLLQAGSFRNPADAEGLRARLLLLGLEVHTRAVQMDNGDTWNRVLVGPFTSTRELQRARTRLREQDIDAIQLARRIGGP